MTKKLTEQARRYESEGRFVDAILSLKEALSHEPDNYVIQLELGNLYTLTKEYEEAVGYFRSCYRVLRENTEIKEALCFTLSELGNQYQLQSQFLLSEVCFEEIIQYEKNNWVYYYNLANAQDRLHKYKEAYQNYQKALILNDQDADLWNNLGNVERELGHLDLAIKSYQNALNINPNLFHAELHLTHQKQHMCDWKSIDKHFKHIRDIVNEYPESLISPFAFVSNPESSLKDQLRCANQWTQNHYQSIEVIKEKTTYIHKIKIGYLSSDFKIHPLYFLIRDIIKYHDRTHFEIYAYDASPYENTHERNTLIALFDHHQDISRINDAKAAELIEEDKINILVDLTGYTNNSRAFIAPRLVNVATINWLGYPGTMGKTQNQSLYDYILADDFIIPQSDEKYYTESILRLPFAYQPNILDRSQINQKHRADYGLPKDAFIYCGFNQSFKITEFIFKTWLRLLKKYESTVLWLTHSNDWATINLRNYAKEHGIDPSRIIFASRVSNAEHIARHALADLYLDTMPYNAHTSASDALSMNLPIVTLKGKTFASRVAGSLLHSLGLDELIAEDIESYVECVSRLTSDHLHRKNIVKKLELAKKTSALFQPKIFTKALEDIYQNLI